jgi:hypothetical protein
MEKFGKDNNNSRRDFLKQAMAVTAGFLVKPEALFSQEQIAPTYFARTNEKFKNGEFVYNLEDESGKRIGEFWPIKGLNLITKETHPEAFEGSIEEIQKKLGDKNIVATAPDGMTGGSLGAYQMEGKSLANGVPCGDGEVKNYGIVTVENGFKINFTHKQEHLNDFDSFYESIKDKKGTLFFLPSIYRNGKFISSENKIDKVLIRRSVPDGEQIGAVFFDQMITYNEARQAILGLNRDGKSETTHVYVLDGGGQWGQSAKEVSGKVVVKGTRDDDVVTNYLVFY